MITNVYFGTNAGAAVASGASDTFFTVTNTQGQAFTVHFSPQDGDVVGQTMPEFAWSVIGPLTQYTNVPPGHPGYQVTVTKFSDIVTDAPPAVTLSAPITSSPKSKTVTWSAVPRSYSYSVQTATNVAGPYRPELRFEAVLRGVNENPPNVSGATGFGTVTLSPDQTTITVNERFSNISAPASASHIHGPAGPGTNASVLFPFSGVPAATSGAIPEQSFAITPTQVGYLTNGLLYMNVHDSIYPGGEIRAQLYLVPSVGLTFTTTNGSYTDVNTAGDQKYYRIVTP
jgi:hypothetical protein